MYHKQCYFCSWGSIKFVRIETEITRQASPSDLRLWQPPAEPTAWSTPCHPQLSQWDKGQTTVEAFRLGLASLPSPRQPTAFGVERFWDGTAGNAKTHVWLVDQICWVTNGDIRGVSQRAARSGVAAVPAPRYSTICHRGSWSHGDLSPYLTNVSQWDLWIGFTSITFLKKDLF